MIFLLYINISTKNINHKILFSMEFKIETLLLVTRKVIKVFKMGSETLKCDRKCEVKANSLSYFLYIAFFIFFTK